MDQQEPQEPCSPHVKTNNEETLFLFVVFILFKPIGGSGGIHGSPGV
jgi:hypothetical protein